VYAVGALLVPQTEYTAEVSREILAKRRSTDHSSAALCFGYVLYRAHYRDELHKWHTGHPLLCCLLTAILNRRLTLACTSTLGRALELTRHRKLAGLAVRECVGLGYHRSARKMDIVSEPLRVEMRRRVFWSAYSMECASCTHLGRPLSLHFNEIDAEVGLCLLHQFRILIMLQMLTDADDLYIATGGRDGRMRFSKEDPPTNVTRAVYSIRLRALQGRIQTALYSDTRDSEPRSQSYDETIAQLRLGLEAWKSELPDVLPPTGPALSLFMTADWSLLVYNQAVLQLYRPQLTSSAINATKSDITDLCVPLAAHLCHAYRRQYFGKPTTYTWGALHELFLAGLTYVYCIRVSPTIRARLGYEKISKTCNDCTITFVILAERWKDAAPYRDLFEAISSTTLALVSQPQPSQPSDMSQTLGSQLSLSEDHSLSDMFAMFTNEVDAPAQIDTMLDALLTEWN
jgi:hypothetical protein